MNYYPKRPVKSFQDLEVYQKALAICVAVVKKIPAQEELHQCIVALPRLIATAHSLRFSDQQKAIDILEDAMLKCNLSVVYLDQYRDIDNKEIEIEFFEKQIKDLLSLRIKIMHLQRSWRKFFQTKIYEK
ncbi:hypothetical protein M1523_01460 [Patescibacteria group bacterium]|nr:hypothetical protein [Patescibacteria group bacterium]MCL5091552.1 hypothetical protein [Patescibacteria group bacterium]